MSTDWFSRACLVVIIFLLLLVLLQPVLAPSKSVNAAKSYRYELVQVSDDIKAEETRMTLERYARDGWELAAAPFFSGAPDNWARGYLIFRK